MAQPYAPPCQEGLIRAEPCPRQAGREIAPGRRRWVLAGCIIASAMGFIDGSALTVALPAMRAELATNLAALHWVINAYVLALSSLALIGGALADAYGKGRVLAIGCALFGAASVWCALADDVGMLIAARAVQGIGAAIVVPSSLALIGSVYPEEERGRAIGVWAAASALTTAGGPILGGWLVGEFGWQAVFWINPPLALLAAALVLAFAPTAPREAPRFDAVGAGLLAGGLGALAYGLGALGGNGVHAIAEAWAFAAAFAFIGAFVLYEGRARAPMVPLSIFRSRMFSGLNAATLLVYSGLSLMFFLMPFHLSERYGLSALEVGAVFLPFTLGVGLLSGLFGGLADRLGARGFLVGAHLLAAAAFAWMAAGADWGLWAGVIAPMAVVGLAFAIEIAPLTAQVLSSLRKDQVGLASGVNNAVARTAQLIGVAGAAAVGASAAGYAAGLWIAAGLAVLAALAAQAAFPTQPAPAAA